MDEEYIGDTEVEELIIEENIIFKDLRYGLVERQKLDWIEVLELEQEMYSIINRVSNLLARVGIMTLENFINKFNFTNDLVVEVFS